MTGIFYGSTTGATQALAREIARRLGIATADIHNVAHTLAEKTRPYDLLLLGSSTWECGRLQSDWPPFLDALSQMDLCTKRVALFGCGDSLYYPATFCNALGIIYDALLPTGCTFVGTYVPKNYDVTDSQVCRNGRFVGLAIDESDVAMTDRRVAEWCHLLACL